MEEESGGISYTLPTDLSPAYNDLLHLVLHFIAGWAYGFHMPLFFILSGAVLAITFRNRNISFGDFVESKIKRLILPYYLYGFLFMIPIKYFTDFYDNNGLKTAVQNFINGVDVGHFWFIPSLFWCMTIFVLIQKIVSKYTDSYLVLYLAAIVVYAASLELPFDIFWMKKGLLYIGWFTFGYIFEMERSKVRIALKNSTLLILIVLFIVAEVFLVRYEINYVFYTVLAGSGLTYFISLFLSRNLKRLPQTKLWDVIIRNLFNVYLLHVPLEYVILKLFFENNWLCTTFGVYMYTFSRTVFLFVLCILIGEGIEKVKRIFLKRFSWEVR